MRYEILIRDNLSDLEEQVNLYIGQGWRPIGGVSCARWEWQDRKGYTEDAWTWAQAMIKEHADNAD